MNNPNDVTRLKHFDSLASHVNVLGSASSTVDGGLWYELEDGLPIIKMNYHGGDFLIDTKLDGGVLIGDVLYLSGHKFQFTGFASGLTFSDNNFYVADTVVGSVSDCQFVFTDAAALSVAEGDSIAITQLDSDAVNFSLDLDSLNGTPTPWNFSDYFTGIGTGTYTYTTGTGTGGYKRTSDTAYIVNSTNEQQVLTLKLAENLEPDKEGDDASLNDKQWNRKLRTDSPTFTATSFAQYVTVKEIYNDTGALTEFVVTIKNDDVIQETVDGKVDWLYQITATAPEGVTATIQFDGTTHGYYEHEDGSFTRDETTGIYTFKTDKYVAGYYDVDSSANVAKLEHKTMPQTSTGLDEIIQGDWCTINGLADGLTAIRTDAYKYTIYKSNTEVGTIDHGIITISSADAFKEVKAGVVATVIDTQGKGTDTSLTYLGYKIKVSSALAAQPEGFVRVNGAYKYTTGAAGFITTSIQGFSATNTVSYVTLGDKELDLSITGIPDLGKLIINGNQITKEDGTYIGAIDTTNKTITIGSSTSGYLFSSPELTISGFNGYVFNAVYYGDISLTRFYKSYIACYSAIDDIGYSVDTYFVGYSLSDDKKTATYRNGVSFKYVRLTRPTGYIAISYSVTVGQWAPYISAEEYNALSNEEKTAYNKWGDTKYYLRAATNHIKFCEFDGQDWVFNSHAFDGVTTADTINITDEVRSTPINFNIELATDADTLAVSRTFANEAFTAGATAGTYTYTATGSTAGWNVSADGAQIASWELNGKTFTLENLRTDLGDLGFDSKGYIHATNGSTIGRMGGNVIKLYDNAVHKLATPILTGADAADFTLILPT